MKQWKVGIKVYRGLGHIDYRTITVTAGNKRIAMMRALTEIGKNKEFEGLYKTVATIEEVKENVNQGSTL